MAFVRRSQADNNKVHPETQNSPVASSAYVRSLDTKRETGSPSFRGHIEEK